MVNFGFKKCNKYRIVLIVLIALSLAFIWYNSSKSATDSTNDSQNIAQIIAPSILPDYSSMDSAQQQKALDSVHLPLRSLAHVFEFAILAFFTGLFVRSYPWFNHRWVVALLVALAFTFIIAVTDEVDQLFVDGRVCDLKDVLLDSLGGLIGCLLATLSLRVIKAR